MEAYFRTRTKDGRFGFPTELPIDSVGKPFLPSKGDTVYLEGIYFVVVEVEWDYDRSVVIVYAEPKES